jgi:hypothetical protein
LRTRNVARPLADFATPLISPFPRMDSASGWVSPRPNLAHVRKGIHGFAFKKYPMALSSDFLWVIVTHIGV